MSLVEIWFEIWVNNNKITTLRIDSQALIPLNLHHWTYVIISNYHIICIIWYTSWIDVPYFIHCHMDLQIDLVTLPATNSSHLKMDGWNTNFLLGWPILSKQQALELGSSFWQWSHRFQDPHLSPGPQGAVPLHHFAGSEVHETWWGETSLGWQFPISVHNSHQSFIRKFFSSQCKHFEETL